MVTPPLRSEGTCAPARTHPCTHMHTPQRPTVSAHDSGPAQCEPGAQGSPEPCLGMLSTDRLCPPSSERPSTRCVLCESPGSGQGASSVALGAAGSLVAPGVQSW